MLRTAVAMLSSAAITFAVTASSGYVPPNRTAGGPPASRDTDAMVAEILGCADPETANIQAFVAGCALGLGRVAAVLQGEDVHLTCAPNLGVMAMPPPARQLAIRNTSGREAEDLVGSPTHTRHVRTGAPSGSPGRAGAGARGAQP